MLIAVGFVILSLMSLVFSGLEMYGTLKRTHCKMISAFVFRFILLAAFSSLLLYQVLMNMDYWNAIKQFVKDSRKGKEAEIESDTIAVLQIASIGLTIFFTAWNLFRVILQSMTLCCLGNTISTNDQSHMINTDNNKRRRRGDRHSKSFVVMSNRPDSSIKLDHESSSIVKETQSRRALPGIPVLPATAAAGSQPQNAIKTEEIPHDSWTEAPPPQYPKLNEMTDDYDDSSATRNGNTSITAPEGIVNASAPPLYPTFGRGQHDYGQQFGQDFQDFMQQLQGTTPSVR